MAPADMSRPQRKVPEYVRVAGELRDQIKSGALAPHDTVPSAAGLCAQYGVSMITAKSALNLLRGEGLVYGVAGRGTFVSEVVPTIRTAPHRYFQQRERTYLHETEREGRTPTAEHSTREIRATDWTAQRLEISPGDDVVETTYLISADGRPMSQSVSWEPLAITGGTAIQHPHEGPHATGGLNARFQVIGWSIEQVEEHLLVRRPTPEELAALAVPDGVSVVEVRQTVRATYDDRDDLVAVQAADIVFPADRYEFRYLMDRPR
jgi:GntR family transcriptional regulator